MLVGHYQYISFAILSMYNTDLSFLFINYFSSDCKWSIIRNIHSLSKDIHETLKYSVWGWVTDLSKDLTTWSVAYFVIFLKVQFISLKLFITNAFGQKSSLTKEIHNYFLYKIMLFIWMYFARQEQTITKYVVYL